MAKKKDAQAPKLATIEPLGVSEGSPDAGDRRAMILLFCTIAPRTIFGRALSAAFT